MFLNDKYDTRKSRFQNQIEGNLGEYWIKDAQRQIEKVVDEYNKGKITVDEYGVAYNSIGRVVIDEVAEILEYSGVCDRFSREVTNIKRSIETSKAIKEYKESKQPITDEEIAEMRATFGKGTTVVDILTNQEIVL